MKKLSHLCLAFLIAFSVFAFTGCGKKPVESATVRGLSLTVVKNDELDTSKAVVTAKYKGGDKKEFSGNDLSFGALDTSTTGQKELSIKIVPENFTFNVTIKVVADEADVAAISQLESQLLKEYQANRTNTNEFEKFADTTEKPLYVGHNNTFHFRLKAAGIGADGETLITDIGRVRTVVTVEKKINDQQYELLEDASLAQYVEVNPINAQFEFKEAAEDGVFRITVEPANPDEAYEESNYKFTATVKVVDGFNVYDTTDLSVYDNLNTSANPLSKNADFNQHASKYAEEGWKPFHDEVKARYGLTDTGIANIKRIIFQADIVIDQSKAEGRVREDFFWQANDDSYQAHENVSEDVVLGTPHNISQYALFYREIKDGETFDVIGNFFSINASKIPLMVSCEFETPDKGVDSKNDRGMTAYTALFRTAPKYGTTITNPNTKVSYSDLAYIGNGEMSPDCRVSGSILLMKHDEINFYATNTVANNFYMTYYFAYGNPNNPNDGVYTIEKCSAYNSYSSLIYIFGGEQTNIIDCKLMHSGGPAILAQCELEDTSYDHEWYGEYRVSGEISLPPEINLVNSKIESRLSGQEGWFNTYPGSGALVGGIAAMGGAVEGMSEYPQSGYGFTGKTVVADTMTDGDKQVPRVNIQCVIFGPGIATNTKEISGTINVYKSKAEFEAGTLTTHSLDLDNELNEHVKDVAKPLFECTETGAYRGAITSPTSFDDDKYSSVYFDGSDEWTGDHVNMYMPQHYGYMGALLGLY